MNGMILIEKIQIRQVNGLYCLNDLHRASGGENRHRPQYWLENKQTADLIDFLQADGIPSGQENQQVIYVMNGVGTFACEELIYNYAAWISPKFNALVYRTFKNTVQQNAGSLKALPQNYAAALRELADETERRAFAEQQLALAAPKVAAQDLLAAAEGAKPISNIAKELKQPRNRFFSDLHVKGWIFRQGGVWVGKADKIARGYITHTYHNITHTDGSVTVQTQALITPKGAAKLAEIFGVQS